MDQFREIFAEHWYLFIGAIALWGVFDLIRVPRERRQREVNEKLMDEGICLTCGGSGGRDVPFYQVADENNSKCYACGGTGRRDYVGRKKKKGRGKTKSKPVTHSILFGVFIAAVYYYYLFISGQLF